MNNHKVIVTYKYIKKYFFSNTTKNVNTYTGRNKIISFQEIVCYYLFQKRLNKAGKDKQEVDAKSDRSRSSDRRTPRSEERDLRSAGKTLNGYLSHLIVTLLSRLKLDQLSFFRFLNRQWFILLVYQIVC